MANEGWRMAYGVWRMANGEWRMADGGWRAAKLQSGSVEDALVSNFVRRRAVGGSSGHTSKAMRW
ncbi:hypothetical protein [Cohnella sp. 56]|uniref:hypothetical protein n=1 Tax=Cohnella sp. 56 TaxID=3113722 RepID=UPI0030E9DFFC